MRLIELLRIFQLKSVPRWRLTIAGCKTADYETFFEKGQRADRQMNVSGTKEKIPNNTASKNYKTRAWGSDQDAKASS